MDFHRIPIAGPVADIFLGLWLLLPFGMGGLWFLDHRTMRSDMTQLSNHYAEAKLRYAKLKQGYDLLDPIRWQVEGGTDSERHAYVAVEWGKECDTPDLARVIHSLQHEMKERK